MAQLPRRAPSIAPMTMVIATTKRDDFLIEFASKTFLLSLKNRRFRVLLQRTNVDGLMFRFPQRFMNVSRQVYRVSVGAVFNGQGLLTFFGIAPQSPIFSLSQLLNVVETYDKKSPCNALKRESNWEFPCRILWYVA